MTNLINNIYGSEKQLKIEEIQTILPDLSDITDMKIEKLFTLRKYFIATISGSDDSGINVYKAIYSIDGFTWKLLNVDGEIVNVYDCEIQGTYSVFVQLSDGTIGAYDNLDNSMRELENKNTSITNIQVIDGIFAYVDNSTNEIVWYNSNDLFKHSKSLSNLLTEGYTFNKLYLYDSNTILFIENDNIPTTKINTYTISTNITKNILIISDNIELYILNNYICYLPDHFNTLYVIDINGANISETNLSSVYATLLTDFYINGFYYIAFNEFYIQSREYKLNIYYTTDITNGFQLLSVNTEINNNYPMCIINYSNNYLFISCRFDSNYKTYYSEDGINFSYLNDDYYNNVFSTNGVFISTNYNKITQYSTDLQKWTTLTSIPAKDNVLAYNDTDIFYIDSSQQQIIRNTIYINSISDFSKTLLETLYPIGSVIILGVNTNPTIIYNFGIWEYVMSIGENTESIFYYKRIG